MSKPNKITSWSFSRYVTYKQCPFKAKLQFIDKIKEPPNEAMERGIKIHNVAEDYLNSKITSMPEPLKKFSSMFRKLRKEYRKKITDMVVEDTWAFTSDWGETTWDDWTNCWVRIKLDCAHPENKVTLRVKDWKTGKYRQDNLQDYIEQLQLYALAALLKYPWIKEVWPELVYLDEGTVFPEPQDRAEMDLFFTQDDVPSLIKLWSNRVKPMLNDRQFAPRPNNKCCWCFFRASNKANGGGQCKF